MENTTYKRTSRHPSDETRERIRQSLVGRPKPEQVKQLISASMKAYWADDDNFPDDQEDGSGGWGSIMENE